MPHAFAFFLTPSGLPSDFNLLGERLRELIRHQGVADRDTAEPRPRILKEESMLDRTIVLGTIAACMSATSVAAQAPAPTITAFDGKYAGTATESRGRSYNLTWDTIKSVDMTVTGGQSGHPRNIV
jgi:hypothetical protein